LENRFDAIITYKLELELEDQDGKKFIQKRNGHIKMRPPKEFIAPLDDSYFIPEVLRIEMQDMEEFQNDQNGFDKTKNLRFSLIDYNVEK
jgi:hypothetical protein